MSVRTRCHLVSNGVEIMRAIGVDAMHGEIHVTSRPAEGSAFAPVTKRSGKQIVVVMRRACQVWLRTAVYHWVRVAVMQDAHTRTRYAALRKRGQPHGQALRSVANRLLAMACAMLSSGTLFDPTRMSQRQATA
jgi:hypothetical protein